MDEFPHTITFQSLTKASDGGGGYDESWTDFLTTDAFVCPVSSNERYQAQQTQSFINHNVFYPYQEGVKPDMRIKWHDKQEMKKIDGVDTLVNLTLSLHSNPIDQGGQGEILLVKAELA